MIRLILFAMTAAVGVTFQMKSPMKIIKNMFGVDGWRRANIENQERKQFTQRNIGPIVQKSGVSAESLITQVEEGNANVFSRGESVGLQDREENQTENLKREKQELEDELQLIWAIEQRNEAQLGSFVDEEAQWLSMSDEERQLLTRKPFVEECIDALNQVLAAYDEQ